MCVSVHKDALRKEARQRALFSIIQYFCILLSNVSLSAVERLEGRRIFREIFGIAWAFWLGSACCVNKTTCVQRVMQ